MNQIALKMSGRECEAHAIQVPLAETVISSPLQIMRPVDANAHVNTSPGCDILSPPYRHP